VHAHGYCNSLNRTHFTLIDFLWNKRAELPLYQQFTPARVVALPVTELVNYQPQEFVEQLERYHRTMKESGVPSMACAFILRAKAHPLRGVSFFGFINPECQL
jgi:hypothetical protein